MPGAVPAAGDTEGHFQEVQCDKYRKGLSPRYSTAKSQGAAQKGSLTSKETIYGLRQHLGLCLYCGEAGHLITYCPEKQRTQAPSKYVGPGPKKKMTKGDKRLRPAKVAMATEETPSSDEESFPEILDTEESSELSGNDDNLA
uniref:Uncharacterized protein n=1 Tax=Sphaerodactylus townsendi TaxID=933632 RepID=A0ACB8FBV3_9SAUR